MYKNQTELLESGHPILDCKPYLVSCYLGRLNFWIEFDDVEFVCELKNIKQTTSFFSGRTLKENLEGYKSSGIETPYDVFEINELIDDGSNTIIAKWGEETSEG